MDHPDGWGKAEHLEQWRAACDPDGLEEVKKEKPKPGRERFKVRTL